MADNAEHIGGVSVSITADAAQLASDFDAAVALAVEKGATLKEAIQAAMAAPDTAQVTKALEEIGAASASTVEQLKLFDQATHIDYSDASGQMNLFATELEALGPSAQQAIDGIMKLPVALDEAGSKAHETENLFVEFGQKVSEIVEHPVQQFRALVEAMGPVAIGAIALGAAFYEVGKAIAELVLEEAAAARSTENLANRLNLTFEETKKLGEMASVVGVNIESLSRVSMRLADALEDPAGAGKKVAAALADLGIVAGDSGDALKQLLEKLASIPDATERISAAHAVMGRGAVQLEPLLRNYDELSKAVEALGGQLDSHLVKQLLEANKAAGLLGIAWDHLKESLAAAFAPAVTEAMKMLTALLTDPKPLTLEEQIASLTQEIKDLGVAAADSGHKVSAFFANSTGMSEPTANTDYIEQRKAALDLLVGQKEAIERSKEYNQVLDESNALQKQGVQSTNEYAAALYAAYAQLGVKNYSTLTAATFDDSGAMSKFSDMGAFAALADKSIADALGGPRLVEAADNLEKRLQEAFHSGAISAEEFHTAVERVEKKLNQARDAGLSLGETLPRAFTGFNISGLLATLDGSFAKLTDDLAKSGAGAGDWAVKLNTAVGSVKGSMDSTGTVFATQLPGLDQLQQALIKLNITADETGKAMTKNLAAFNVVVGDGRSSLEQVDLAWARVGGTINKLAKADLPLAIAEYDKLIVAMQQRGAAQGDILAEQEKELQLVIKIKEARGVDATADIEHLTRLQFETKALHDASAGLGEVYKSLRITFDNAFGSLSKGLADAIVNGKNLGDVFINVGKQIATSVLDTIIKGALLPLESQLNKTGGLFDTIATKLTGGLGKFIPGLGSAAATAGSGEVLKETAGLAKLGTSQVGADVGSGEVTSGAAGAGGGGGGAGGLGGLLSAANPVMGLVQAGITAAAGIVQGFQMAHLENLTGEIEVTSRKIFNTLANPGNQSIVGATVQTWMDLDVMIGQLSDLHNDNVEILGKFDDLMNSGGGFGGGGGGGGTGGLTASQTLDLIVGVNDGRVRRGTLPVGNPLNPGGPPSLSTPTAADVNAVNSFATAATAGSTALTTFSAQTATAGASTETAAEATATLSKAQQAQVAYLGAQLDADLAHAHELLAAGSEALLNSREIFALARESAINPSFEQIPLTAEELAMRSTVNAMAAVQATWNGGVQQVAQSLSAVAPALIEASTALTAAVSPYAGGAPISGPSGGNTYADILRLTGGSGNVGQALADAQNALANDLTSPRTDSVAINEENRMRQLIFDLSKFASSKGSWGGQMPGAAIDPAAYRMPSYAGTPPTVTNPYTGGSGGFSPVGGAPTVTVYAVNPEARGIRDGVVLGLREVGVKVS